MLDTQANTSFITPTLAARMGAKGVSTELRLTTMSQKDQRVKTIKLENITVTGLLERQPVKINAVFTKQDLHGDLSHVPTPEKVGKWEHLKQVSKELLPLVHHDVEMLIGYNCPQAFRSEEVVKGNWDEPTATKTPLGWYVMESEDPGISTSASVLFA